MARSLLEKYEQILAADPRSRIFVELGKALLERGDHARAVAICRQGLEHHPASILGRVVLGRALLERGELPGALEQFGLATGLDPGSPYAFNLVGEALLARGLHAEAVPVLQRAVELQPGDARVRGWLDDARRTLKANGAANGVSAAGAASAAATNGASAKGGEKVVTSTSDPSDGSAGAAVATPAPAAPSELAATGQIHEQQSTGANAELQPGREDEPSTDPAPRAPAAAGSSETAAGSTLTEPSPSEADPASPFAPSAGAQGAPESRGADEETAGDLAFADLGPDPLLALVEPEADTTDADARGSLGEAAAALDALDGGTPVLERVSLRALPTPPPLAPVLTPPPIRLDRGDAPGSLLSLIPDGSAPRNGVARNLAEAPAPVVPPAHATPDPAEAALIAAEFEQEMRARLMAVPEPPPSALRRHRKAVLAVAAVLAMVGAASVYLVVDARNAARLAVGAAAKARAGLARDTSGSLGEAARLLAQARRRSGADPELASLAAQISAVLAAEQGDEEARALATRLVGEGHAGDGALVARWLLAADPAERAAAETALLAAPPSSEPLVQALAGRILLARGQRESGRARLDLAAHATPPLLRALTDLGDDALAAGDPERALAFHAAVLAVQPTHPRAAVGAAEARLELAQDLDTARQVLAAVEADRGSVPPRDLRERFALATARVLAATGDAAGAGDRLAAATRDLGDSPALAAAAAEVQLAARAWDRAVAAGRRAVELAPKDVAARALLARALIGRGKPAEALGATEGFEGRAVRIQRAVARLRLGQPASARAELERTVHDGRMPAEAAVQYALAEVAGGHPDRARGILEKLLATRNPPAITHLAMGRALEAEEKPDDAERSYRAAAERDPAAPEPQLALGALLLAQKRAADAVPVLERAVALDPSDPDAHRALGAARLEAGKPAEARAELDAALLIRPSDPEALRLVSAAWLTENQPAEALRAAQRGLASAPRHVPLLLAGARAAAAAGERQEAKVLAATALKRAPKGPTAAEAKQILAKVARR